MRQYEKFSIRELFFVIAISFAVLYALMFFTTNGMSLITSLHKDPHDAFMDFFNSIYDAMGSYEETGVIYPPFINLCFRALGTVVTPFASNSFGLRSTEIGGMCFAIFVMIIVVTIYFIVKSIYNGKKKDVLALLIVLSLPFLYCIERGNIIIVAALLIVPFILWYDSEDPRRRLVAYVCLALSVNIKLYPVIFSVLILREKRYKEFVYFAILVAAIFFMSLLILHDSLLEFLDNIFSTSSSGDYGGIGITSFVYHIMHIINATNCTRIVSLIVMGAVLLLSVYLMLTIKKMEKWKIAALLSIILCTCGTFNSYYCLVYMFVPLILFLNSNPTRNKLNIAYLTLFLIMFVPITGFSGYGIDINISYTINGFAPTIMLLLLLVDGYKGLKEQKNGATDAGFGPTC